MKKISLSSYSVRIKDRNTSKYVKLDEFLPKKDFLTFVHEYFKFIETSVHKDDLNKKLIRINNQTIKSVKRQLKGIIETGEYGFESDFIDSNKGDLKYKRKATDAEMLPFYFLISLPQGKDRGFIILQRFGQFGIAKIIKNSMSQFLKQRSDKLVLEFNPLVATNLIDEFLEKGNVTKLIFKKLSIPKDFANYFDTKSTKDLKGHIEFRVVASRNSTLPVKGTIKKLLTAGKRANRLLEINGVNYNSAKVMVTLNNDKRTVDLGNFSKFRAYYDVTDDVKIGSNGHPTFTSIDVAGVKLLTDLFELIYPGQDVE